MKKRKFISKSCATLIILAMMIAVPITAYAAPADENYDDNSVGYSDSSAVQTIDELKYTLSGSGLVIDITNDSAWSTLGDDDMDHFIGINAATVKIEAVSGSSFKLNGFTMDVFATGDVTITPSSGSAITRTCSGSNQIYSVNVSGNPDFENITSVTFSGDELYICLDDLDFEAAVVPTYSITYDGSNADSGSAPTDGNTYANGTDVAVLGQGSLVKTGYSFQGWNTESDGSGTTYAEAATYTMGSADVTLYDKWSEDNYSITYNSNSATSGSAPTDGSTYHYNDAATAATNSGGLVRTGYTFNGWNTANDGSGTHYDVSASITMTGTLTLYAEWTPIDYTVTYNGNTNTGGAVPTDGNTYNITDTVTVLGENTLIKTGYSFVEWDTASDGSGTAYSENDTFAMGSANVTLFAQWSQANYSITYNSNSATSGSGPTDGSTYHYNDAATAATNSGSLVRTGYTFNGWNTASNGSGTHYNVSAGITMTGNLTLYAEWTPIDYTITYDGNTNEGGAVPTDSNTYNITDTVTVLGNTGSLVKAGYTFNGWNTAANGSGTIYASGDTFAMGSSNVTLYAQWTNVTSVFNKAYIPSYGSGYIDVYDLTTDTMELKKIQVGSGPVTGVISPTGTQVFVSNMNSNSVSIIDPLTDMVVNTLTTGFNQPFGIAFNESGSKAYVANYASANLTVIDTTTWEQSTITLESNMGTVETVGNYVYVAGWHNNNVYKIDIATSSVVATLNVGANTQGMTSSLDGTKLYLGCTDGYMKVIELDTFTMGTGVNLGSSLAGVEITPDGSRVFVSSTNTNKCYSINLNDFSDKTESTIGSSNYGLGIQGDYAYVLAMGSSKMYKIKLETNEVVSEVTTSPSPVAMGRFMISTRVYSEVGGDTTSDDATLSLLSLSSGSLNPIFDSNTETYTASVANGVSSLTVTPTVNDSNATVTVQSTSVTSGSESGSINLAVGNNTITVVVTAENASTKTYTITVTRAPDTTAPALTAGTVSRTSDTAGTVKFTSDEAGSYYYAVVDDGAATPAIDTTGAGTTCTTAETTITDPTGLTAGAKDIYIKVKDAAGNVSDALKIDIAAYVPSGGAGGSVPPGDSGNGSTETQPTQDKTTVIVNGETQQAGTETVTNEDGRSTVTVEVDNTIIEASVAEAIQNNTTGSDNVIQIPVSDTTSDVAKVELTGDIVKTLEENTFDVSVNRNNVEYVIPAEEFRISSVAEAFGITESNLNDITVEVNISLADEHVVEQYNALANANNSELIFPPVSFEVVAKTTNADGTTTEVTINEFDQYVERVMEIPAGTDPDKITTGIVFNPDGTYRHVPTQIIVIDGIYYAKIKSLTNSTYSVIYNPVTFTDIAGHWAMDAINDMGSRLVVTGMSNGAFEPDRNITRAEFAAIIIRALGLPERSGDSSFSDISADDWCCGAVETAVSYGLITGYPDGTFGPNDQITREQAMTIIARAMSITGLSTNITSDEISLDDFTDASDVSAYARESAVACLSTGIITGRDNNILAPNDNMTRAEAAVIAMRLLQQSGLI